MQQTSARHSVAVSGSLAACGKLDAFPSPLWGGARGGDIIQRGRRTPPPPTPPHTRSASALLAGEGSTRDFPLSAHGLIDLLLRGGERILGCRLPNQRRLHGGRHDLADRGPLWNERAPFRIDVLAERSGGGVDEIVAVAVHQLAVLRVLPQRRAVDVGPFVSAGEFVARRTLRLLRCRP